MILRLLAVSIWKKLPTELIKLVNPDKESPGSKKTGASSEQPMESVRQGSNIGPGRFMESVFSRTVREGGSACWKSKAE